MKIKEFLYKDKNEYQLKLGYGMHSVNKELIFEVYDECEKVNFKPSRVEQIFVKYSKINGHSRKPKEYRIQKRNDTSHILYVRGWYIKCANPQKINEILDEYLYSEDKDAWIDTHAKLRRKKSNSGERFVHFIKVTGKYRVSKYDPTMRKNKYYGEYDTLEEAVKVRDEKEKQGFPDPGRKRRPYRQDNEMRYIHKNKHGKYIITKNRQHYGTWNTLQDAVDERDWLIENNWSYDNIDLY